MAVDDGKVDTFRLVPLELILQPALRIRPRREHDEARRVAIDPVNDEWFSLAACSQMNGELFFDARPVIAGREGHGQHPGRLVDNDDRRVLVHDAQVAVGAGSAPAAARAAGTIHPDSNAVASLEPASGIGRRRFAIVDEHLAALERFGGAAPRTELSRLGKEAVEPNAAGRDDDAQIASGRYT
jgi:hypothetical protein